MQFLEILSFEGHCALKHGVEQNAERPNVNVEAFIALVSDDLRSEIGRGTTLFLDCLPFLNEATHSEVAKLD